MSVGLRVPYTGLNPFIHRHSQRFECRVTGIAKKNTKIEDSNYFQIIAKMVYVMNPQKNVIHVKMVIIVMIVPNNVRQKIVKIVIKIQVYVTNV